MKNVDSLPEVQAVSRRHQEDELVGDQLFEAILGLDLSVRDLMRAAYEIGYCRAITTIAEGR